MLRIVTCTKTGEFKEPTVERLPELLSDKNSITWVDLYNPRCRGLPGYSSQPKD